MAPREKWRLVHTAAASLGLDLPGPGGGNLHQWRSPPTNEERTTAERLLMSARESADLAGTSDPAKLLSTFGYLRDFCLVTPNRYLFCFPYFRGDITAEAYNEATFAMFAQFIRERGSRVQGQRHGRSLKADTVADHVSRLKTFLERYAGCSLVPPNSASRLVPRQLKHMRAEDGPLNTRKLRMGLRGRHLKALLDRINGPNPPPEFDLRTYAGQLRVTLLLVCHNLLMRGGEPGVTESRTPFSPHLGHITIDSLSFQRLLYEGWYRLTAILLVMSLKDANRRLHPVPLVLMQRAAPNQEAGTSSSHRSSTLNSACAYSAIYALWAWRTSVVPRERRGQQPLFALPPQTGNDRPVTTAFVRDTVRLTCDVLGLPRGLYGGSSPRIGGATDLYDLLGISGMRLIKERGRWQSDVAQIYSRASATAHARISTEMIDAEGIDLEAFAGSWWAQPA